MSAREFADWFAQLRARCDRSAEQARVYAAGDTSSLLSCLHRQLAALAAHALGDRERDGPLANLAEVEVTVEGLLRQSTAAPPAGYGTANRVPLASPADKPAT